MGDKTHLTQAGDGTAETERIRMVISQRDLARTVAMRALHNVRILEAALASINPVALTNKRPLMYKMPDF